MTNAIENARKALERYDEPYYGDDPEGSYRDDCYRLAEALHDLLDATDGEWREGYNAGNLDGYFGSHKEYDKKFGEGAFYA